MAFQGPQFYDDLGVFTEYRGKRARVDNPNDTLEAPLFLEMLGPVQGLDVLDLGCGDGALGLELLHQNARTYTGVDGSARMVDLARERLHAGGAEVYHCPLEDWRGSATVYDRVTARLVLHYVPDLATLFSRIFDCLKPGGRFLFSVEHPVITSCSKSSSGPEPRQDWTVDDYFVTGRRVTTWMGQEVVKYHRTIQDYFDLLLSSGFSVESLRESRPDPGAFSCETEFHRRLRIPLFLILSGMRP